MLSRSLLPSNGAEVSFLAAGVALAYVGIPVVTAVVGAVAQQIRFLIDRRRFPRIRQIKLNQLQEGWAAALAFSAGVSDDTVRSVEGKTMSELRAMLVDGTITSVDLLRVYYHLAHKSHKKTNCVVHVFVNDAIDAARSADQKFSIARGAKEAAAALPPLLGIPMSIKDSTDVKGADSTCGLFGYTLQPALSDSTLVAQLRAAGAVIFVKTNIPALLMSYECRNDVFGVCSNPVDQRFTCGGSSGGEGALIGSGGSPAGMGSDVGGSIRIPAHFCGICGLKPSVNRVAYKGCCPEQGDEGVAPVSGPMARCVADLTTILRVLTPLEPFAGDGMKFNVAFQDHVHQHYLAKPTLNILYYVDDHYVQTSPACKRAVRIAVNALRAEGHIVTEWNPTKAAEVMSAFYELFSADRCQSMRDSLGSDYPYGVIGPCLQLAEFPDRLKWLLGFVMGKLVDPVFGDALTRVKERSVYEYYNLLALRNRLRHHYSEAMQGYDCLLAPGFYTPASPLDSTTDLSYGAGGTATYNVLDLSAVTIPVTTVDRVTDVWREEELAKADNQGMTRLVAKTYDATAMHGLPVGVQVLTPRMTEEQALAIAQRLEAALRRGS